MTLPTLIHKQQEKEFISRWKKFYSDASNAALLMSQNAEDLSSEQKVLDAFSKYIKHTKVCETNKDVEQGCWNANNPIYKYDGTMLNTSPGMFLGGAACMGLVNGGTFCIDSGGINNIIIVDVNGPKRPNKVGTDIFFAMFNRNEYQVRVIKGHLPGWGAADGYWIKVTVGDGTCTGDTVGYGCSAEKLLN